MKRGNGMRMEDMNDLYDRCFSVLSRETELVGKIAALQEEVWKGVAGQDWENIETRLEAVDGLGAEFREAEAEREAVLSEFPGSGDEKGRFYAFVSRFPPASRNKLAGLYRGLKTECLRIRASGDALAGFLGEARTLAEACLEAAFPERRGRLYSSRGTQLPPLSRSLVLNHHF
ncbi:MAG: hypothetical protein LBI86_00630 [Treponema sp.]|jgi:hypothetical protein|nr:hypothetical protein [Treponema sp.]